VIGWPGTGLPGSPLLSAQLVAIGESDCELLGDGALVQPVNALTSIGYVLIGAVVMARATRLSTRRAEALLFGVLLIGVGVGSVLFHGPQPAGSKAMHDLPILLVGVLMLVHDVALLRPSVRALPVFAVIELVVQRRRARPVARSIELRSYLVMASLAAAGGLSYALGRTGAPLCDPDSVVQPHGLWHLLSGLVFATWWWLAYAAVDPR
jgi:hypothetical protein